MSRHGRAIAKNAAVVAGATLLSRVLGFVRDVIVAFALGAGLFADAFFVAFRIPNLLRRLFGEGSLTMAFIPVYSRVMEEEGEEAAQAMARSAMIWLAVILGGITLAAELLAGPLTMAIAPGFIKNVELFETTMALVRICFPYVIFICGVALCMGILNASGHFLAPALAPSVLNVALIASALIGYFTGLNVAYAMAYGVLVGGVGQWLVQQPFLRGIGFSWRGNWSWKNKGVARMGLLMLPTVFGAAVYQLNILLGTLLASFLPVGSVSYLYYADRLVQFPLGVFGIAVSTAALPSLAKLAAKGEMEEYDSALSMALGLTLFIALPAAAGLVGLANPVISLLFERGAFTAEAVTATASALVAYSVGLPFIALSRPLVAGFYALEDTKTPVKIAVACLMVNIGLGVGLMQIMAHVGLALAVSVSSLLNFVLLYAFLSRRRQGGLLPVGSTMKTVFLGLVVGVVAFFDRVVDAVVPALDPGLGAGLHRTGLRAGPGRGPVGPGHGPLARAARQGRGAFMTVDAETILSCREHFPRGLVQPEGGYRFSLDSLLLACFTRPGRRHNGVDIGCGCGVIGLGLLLGNPGITLTGVELDAQAVQAAEANADHLHLSKQFKAVQGDVADWRPDAVVDFVVANPPYRPLGKGRVSRGEERATARFERQAEFATFTRCAAVALKTRGKFVFVHLPERLSGIMAALRANGLEPKRLRMVHPRSDEHARMVLVESVKAASEGLKTEPPLVLHQGRGKQTRFTDEALAFCPFLGCNPGSKEG